MPPRLISPHRLGLPPKFAEWRPVQERAIVAQLDSEVRFDGINAPTGIGKSGIALGIAQLMPEDTRVMILTSTNGLLTQIATDGYGAGLREIRGKRNYRCLAVSPGGQLEDVDEDNDRRSESFISVEHGPCFTAEVECSLKQGGCLWFDKQRALRGSRIAATNYTKWISTVKPDDEFGKFDVLICDEAADAEQHLTDALHIEIRRADVERLLRIPWPAGGSCAGIGSTRTADWREWASHHRVAIESAVRTGEAQLREAMSKGRPSRELLGRLAGLRDLSKSMTALRTLRGDWVLDDLKAYERTIGMMIDPLWPAPYAETLLFRGIPRVILMGATLVEEHLDILGVPREQRKFTAYQSPYAVARRPIIYAKLDPPLKLSWKAEQDERTQKRVVEVGDSIIDARGDRNGLVPSVSYKRAQYILRHSRHRDVLMSHAADGDSTRGAIARFKSYADTPPHVLVSPSIGVGYDFPFEEAEFCWIPKLPFVNRDSALMRARCEVNKRYADFKCANSLMQYTGRGMRDPGDSFETIITDAQFGWFPWVNRDLFSKYFLDAIRTSDGLPRAAIKLRRRTRAP